MKKLLLIAFMFIFAIVTPQLASAKGFSGSTTYSGSKSSSYTGTSSSGTYKSSSSYSSPTTSGTYRSSGSFSGTSGTTSPSSSTTYHSGYKSPSSSVTSRSSNYNSNYYNHNTSSTGRSIATHAAAFGAGALLGSMFHPVGGYYGGVHHGFSLLGFVFDIIGVVIIFAIIKAFFFRGRRY